MVVFENFKLEPSSEVEHVLFWQKCISVFANKESFLINEIVKHKKWRWGAAKFNNERAVQQLKNFWKSDKSWEPEQILKFKNFKILKF